MSKEPSLEKKKKKKPKCLWLVTDRISVFDINRLGWSGLKHLQDNCVGNAETAPRVSPLSAFAFDFRLSLYISIGQ